MDSSDQKHNCQNRLLLFTAVLSFLYYAQAKFHGLSLVGANVVFENEHAVIEFLWSIWGYYYIRSYQYYRVSGIKNFQRALNRSYIDELGYLLLSTTRHDFSLLPEENTIKSSVIRIGFGHYSEYECKPHEYVGPLTSALGWTERKLAFHRSNRIRRGIPKFNFLRKFSDRGSIHRRLRRLILIRDLRPIGFRAVIYPPTDRFMEQGSSKVYVKLSKWVALKWIQIIFRTLVMRPETMENQIPLILGLVPVWYLIFKSW